MKVQCLQNLPIRELLKDSFITDFQFDVKKFKGLFMVMTYKMPSIVLYSNYSIEDTAFIVRSE
jgi:hypothetical protein